MNLVMVNFVVFVLFYFFLERNKILSMQKHDNKSDTLKTRDYETKVTDCVFVLLEFRLITWL